MSDKRFTDAELEAEYTLTSWGAESPEEVQRTRVLSRFYSLPHYDENKGDDGTEDKNESRRQDRSADDHRTSRGKEQHSLEVPLRMREGNSRVPAESQLGPGSKLRVQEGRICCVQTHGKNDHERVCLCEGAGSPASEPTFRPRKRAHFGDGSDAGAPSPARGGSASQERRSDGQQAREPGIVEQESAGGCASQRPDLVGLRDSQAISARKPDAVDHPSHYTSSPACCSSCGSGIECIQITEHMGFNLGNAIKYVWRADLKNDAIEDLRKAAWYINREIQKREQQ